MTRIPDEQVEQVMRECTQPAADLGVTEEQREEIIRWRVLHYLVTPTLEEEAAFFAARRRCIADSRRRLRAYVRRVVADMLCRDQVKSDG